MSDALWDVLVPLVKRYGGQRIIDTVQAIESPDRDSKKPGWWERHAQIVALKNSGRTAKDIGREFGISGNRVSQIWRQDERKKRISAEDAQHDGDIRSLGIPQRIVNVLARQGVKSIDEACKLVKDEISSARIKEFGSVSRQTLIRALRAKGYDV